MNEQKEKLPWWAEWAGKLFYVVLGAFLYALLSWLFQNVLG